MKTYSAHMRGVADALSRYFGSVPFQVRRYRLVLWPLFITLTVLAVMGLDKMKFDMSVEGWFEEDDPALVALNEFRSQFGSEDNLYVVYEPRDGNVFSERSLEVARGIRQDLLERKLDLAPGQDSPLRRITKITGLPNAPVLTAREDALISRHLVVGEIPSQQQELEQIRQMANSQETFPRLYFSPGGRYGAVVIETDFGVASHALDGSASDDAFAGTMNMDYQPKDSGQPTQVQTTDLAEYHAFMKAVEETLEKPEFAEHFDYYPVGNAAVTKYDMKVLEEMGTLYLGMLVMIALVLWFLFRSVSGVLWPLSVVVLSGLWTIGLFGWLGVTATGFLILTIVMILVVGIADAIHILSGYLYHRNQGEDHDGALRCAYRGSANAVLLTTLTTMLAMLSVTLTPIAPIKVFGVMTAAGIAFAFILSVFFLPLLLDLWWPAKRDQSRTTVSRFSAARYLPDLSQGLQRLLAGVLPFVQRNRYVVVTLFLTALGVCLYGATQVRIDTDPVAQYREDSKIRTNFQIADEHMMGSQSLMIYFDLAEKYAFHDPRVLKKLEQLQQEFESQYSDYVVRTGSLVDVAKKSFQVLNENRDDMYKVPPREDLLAQTLFMFDSSNPEERRKMVSDDYSEAQITVYLSNAGSYEYSRIFGRMQNDLDAALTDLKSDYPQASATVTGLFTLMMEGSDYLSRTSLQTFGIAIIAVTVVLLLVFGNLRLGLVSIIANMLPAALAFGGLGLLGLPVDFSTVLIAPIIIGIAVDDTIHFISHYQQQLAVEGDIVRALKRTIETVGQAVIFTSLILGLGLAILMFSSSVGTATVGLMGSMAILTALLSDLFLLPALLLIFPTADVKGAQKATGVRNV